MFGFVLGQHTSLSSTCVHGKGKAGKSAETTPGAENRAGSSRQLE